MSIYALLTIAAVITAPREVVEILDIAPVWSGHPVGFQLLTHDDTQFVAFYDVERRMTVGARPLDSKAWQFEQLPETVGWDSHNYITMAVDNDGHIHRLFDAYGRFCDGDMVPGNFIDLR